MDRSLISYHAFRLIPGEDLRNSIEEKVRQKKIEAGWMAGCVGSLRTCCLRYANQPEASGKSGYFEILSLSGTVSIHGCHLHLSVGDPTGQAMGGHLLKGCLVYTTAEIVIAQSHEYRFKRVKDERTGWDELEISRT